MTKSSKLESIDGMTFEEAMSEMEKTVKALEEGSLPLEESLEMFEYGIHLSRFLHGKLKSAELKINELVEENSEIVERPLYTGGSEEAADADGS